MRIPVILQSDRAECGLACLAMVAAFHGHRQTLREYRSRFHVSQRGGTLANLRDYAEQLGFQCRAVRAELDELPQLRRPAILHWDLNHFVVLKATGRNSVRIVDPAVGTRRLSIVEASERFTGVAMELMPTMELKRRTATESVGLNSFLPAFRGLGASLGATFVMTLALQAFGLAMPLHTQFTVDQGVRQGDMNIVVALAVGFGLVGLVSATTQWLRTLLVQYVGIQSLCFAYGDDGPSVLEDVNLTVAPGEFVAIEGESGAGKSTLIRLLCKLLTQNSGTILIDGVDTRSLDARDYRRRLGVVMQDDDLFSGSLVENIAVEQGDPDMGRVEDAARMACIHDDIERMPMQYLTLVGHMGSTLSGGQRQRVMIARAIYRRPALILLDEGTAHLNDEIQQRVLDSLRETGATIVAATHDERVLERADRRISLGTP